LITFAAAKIIWRKLKLLIYVTQNKTKQNKTKSKKFIGLMTGLMAFIAITTYSCKKEGSAPSPYNFNLSAVETPDKNRATGSAICLAFQTITDYEKAVTQPTTASQTALNSLIASFPTFISYSSLHPNDTLFRAPNLTKLLNADGVIQMGAYYFKLDPKLKKVFVLPTTQSLYYADLISQFPQSGKVIMFSFDDDVIALINAGVMNNLKLVSIDVATDGSMSNLRGFWGKLVVWVSNTVTDATNSVSVFLGTDCGEINSAAKTSNAESYPGQFVGATNAYCCYKKLGVYFSLYAYLPGPTPSSGITLNFTGGIPNNRGCVYYKVKCKENINNVETTDAGTYDAFNHSRTYQSYQGSRNLSQYYLGFFITYVDYSKVLYLPSKMMIVRSNK
jgi:hypothetical protein